MKKFKDLYRLAFLAESNITLTQPSDPNLLPAYEKINGFVNGNKVTPVSELLSKLSPEDIEKSNIKKEDIDKVIDLAKRPIPGLNNITTDDLFSPNMLVGNIYNSLRDPDSYNLIMETYKNYKSNPTSDNLAVLVITINTINQKGRVGSFIRSTITGLLNYVPGTSTVSSLMLGSIAIASPNMMILSNDFNSLSQGTDIGSMINDISKDSVKYYAIGAAKGAAAIAAGGKAIDKAGDIASDIKNKSSDLLNKIKERQKEQLQKLKDLGLFNKPTTNRTQVTPNVTPRVQLRGKIGATSPAKY